MKKQIMRVFALALGLNSFSMVALSQNEKIGLTALGGVIVGGLGHWTIDRIRRNNRENDKACQEIKKMFASIKAKHESNESDESLPELQRHLNIMAGWDDSCFDGEEKTAKETLASALKQKYEAKCSENRKECANKAVESCLERYAHEFEMNKKGKLSKTLLERYALESHGGSNLAPVSSYYETIAEDYNALAKISIEDLSADNAAVYRSLKQELSAIVKFARAELHEAIQREQENNKKSTHAEEMRRKELEVREKEIALIALQKQEFCKTNREVLAMVQSADSSIKQVEQRSARFEASTERNEAAARRVESELRIPVDLLRGVINGLESIAQQSAAQSRTLEKIENQGAAQARQEMHIKSAIADLRSLIDTHSSHSNNPYANASAPSFDA